MPLKRLTQAATAIALALTAVAAANSPKLRDIRPCGAQRGTTVELTFVGNRLTGPRQVVGYEPGIEILKIKPGKKNNRFMAKVRIKKDCPLGEHRLRARTKRGWTDLRTFFVGQFPVVEEKEDNSSFGDAQPVEANATIHGRVRNEDIDYYKVTAKKGQRISAEVVGMRLGRKQLDPYVAILDADRFELDASDDTALMAQDGYAQAVAPKNGDYYIAVREAAYGGGNARYRLHVGDFPRPALALPMGGRPGKTIELRYIGDAAGTIQSRIKLPNTTGERLPVRAEQNGVSAPTPNWLRVSKHTPVTEKEPNEGRNKATAIDQNPPIALHGVLQEDGDRDWFRFPAKKGQRLNIRVYGRQLGSPVDPVVNFFKAGGKHLSGNDDNRGGLDSFTRQRIPKDGMYELRVRDHLDKGGAGYGYRVEVTPSEPGLELSIPNVQKDDTQSRQFVSVPKGNRWGVLFRVDRNHFGGPVEIVAEELPAGVKMHAPIMAENVNKVPVVFEASKKAKLTGELIELRARHAEKDEITGSFSQTVNLVGGRGNRQVYESATVDRFAVAVTEQAPFSVRIEPPEVPVLRQGRMNLRVVAERNEGFEAPIQVELPFRPPGVGARNKITIGKGETETTYRINANGRANEGEWPIMAVAHAKVDGGPLYVASPITELRVAPQLLTGNIRMNAVERGQSTQIVCELKKHTDFKGKATLKLHGLPNAVTAGGPEKVTASSESATFEVSTTKKSPLGKHKSLFCQLIYEKSGQRMIQSLAGGGVLRIDKPRPKVAQKDDKKQQEQNKKQPEQKEEQLSRLEKLRQNLAEKRKNQ